MATQTTNGLLAGIQTNTIGGLPIACLNRRETAGLMIALTKAHRSGDRPVVMTSANGEVISRCARNPEIDRLFRSADIISADGQPMVLVSKLLSRSPVTERVATTDLVHDVCRHRDANGLKFYLLGATEQENREAADFLAGRYPQIRIVGRSDGYLSGPELEDKIAEINRLAPDILWLAMGVPREQMFCRDFADRLGNVAIIKTSGGLFNFLSGSRARAPRWVQAAGFEWLFRLLQEPRRLFWRYAITNPHALMLLLRKTR